ncbi:MAG TPA: hypothetical protein VMV18_03440 [bacterium]|nr:hypothetical protein [bacterium]
MVSFFLVLAGGMNQVLDGHRLRPDAVSIVALGALLGGILPYAFFHARERRFNREWIAAMVDAVRACGLQPLPKEARAVGRIGRFAIVVRREAREGTAFVVDGLTLQATILTGRASAAVAIGDDAFDARFHVEGDRASALVCLSTEARRAMLHALELFDDLRIEGGRIRARIAAKVPADAVDSLLKNLAALAMMLSPGRAGARELAARFATEPLAPVRRQILEAGLAGYEETAAPLARAALNDGEPRIRLRAAEYLGDAPMLARLAEDPALAGDLRAAALELCSRTLERDAFIALLARLFAATARRPKDAEEFLLALCAWARKTHSRSAQPALLALLEGSAPVRDAAIASLAAVGDVSAVEPLRAFTSGLFTGDTGRAAENAIATIQARLRGAEPGLVSIPESGDGAGALSEPPGAGTLSLARKAPSALNRKP